MAKRTNGFKISVYLDDGRIYFYHVSSADKAKEHSAAIIARGYWHNDGKGLFEHYPVHRILKVKVSGAVVITDYSDD